MLGKQWENYSAIATLHQSKFDDKASSMRVEKLFNVERRKLRVTGSAEEVTKTLRRSRDD